MGREAIESKLIKAGDEIKDIALKAKNKLKETGKEIGSVYEQVKKQAANDKLLVKLPENIQVELFESGFHPASQADEMKAIITKSLRGRPGGESAI